MKKSFLILIIILHYSFTNAQNFVLNYSFEDTISCPTTGGQINLAKYWNSPTLATPDLLNSCNHTGIGVPYNAGGYQLAKTGSGYAGIIALQYNNFSIGYVQGMLSDTLKKDSLYYINFFVSLSHIPSNTAITKMGAYLSNTPVSSSITSTLNLIPQIESPAGYYLKDTTNWMAVSGIYVAQGGEKYITIGNFHDWNHTDTIYFGNGDSGNAYYFIDDVSVKRLKDSTASVKEFGNEKIFSLYPNPNNGKMLLDYSLKANDKAELLIYDIAEKLIDRYEMNASANQIAMSCEGLTNGIYFYQIKVNDKIVQSDKLIIIK